MKTSESIASARPIAPQRRAPRILLGVTGSVAAVKGPELAVRLTKELNAHVKVLLTHGGQSFWTKARDYDHRYWQELHSRDETSSIDRADDGNRTDERRKIHVISAEEEWKEWNKLGDPVLHIELRDWADIAVISPLSAHTLAKLANGLCDDTLTCVMRAWDFGHVRPGKPIILAPAMNTAMWEHPVTSMQLETIVSFGQISGSLARAEIRVVEPQVKTLACGEVGTGALAPMETIIEVVRECLTNSFNTA